MNRRQFLQQIGVSTALFVPSFEALAVARPNPSQEELWSRPREIWITRPESHESGRFVYWADGNVIEDQYWALCKIMRDLHSDKSVAMHIGLLNFQFAIQQGVNFYFGEAPYILTDGYRTEKTNASIENAAKKSRHIEASANDGHYEKPSVEELFKLASWFGVGGVGIYPRHVHVDADKTRRWAGSYGSGKWGHK